MTDPYDAQKQTAGSLSAIVFLVTAIALFTTGPGIETVFSLRGVAFLVGGMFFAPIVVGVPSYILQRIAAKLIVSRVRNPFTTESVRAIKGIGIAIMAAQIAVTAWLTYLGFLYAIP